MTNAIEKRQNENLELFGDRANVREMYDRLRLAIPGGAQAPAGVVFNAAQVAISHGLDPMAGDMYLMEVKGRWVIDIGIGGHRRNAHGKYQFEDSDDYPRLLSEDELAEDMGGKPKAGTVGVEVRLYNLPKARECKRIGIPYYPRRERGYVFPEDDKNIPRGKTPAWLARKRAEKAALRSEFPMEFRPTTPQDTAARVEKRIQQIEMDESPIQRPDAVDDDFLFLVEDTPEPPLSEDDEPEDGVFVLSDELPDEPWPDDPDAESVISDNPFDIDEPMHAQIRAALTGDCRKFADWCIAQHRQSNGEATEGMHGYLVSVIDDICKQDAHRDVLSVLTGREVTKANRAGFELVSKLLDWLPEQRPVKDDDGKSVKGDDGKVVYEQNPEHKPKYVACVRSVWDKALEAQK